MTEPVNPTARRPFVSTILWAAFLASSWTWCIGMFLPVLLVRDLGLWAWVIFTVPNVVGAAIMGSVLARPGRSLQLVIEHRKACEWFSIITLAFHVFFIAWFGDRIAGYWFSLFVLITTCAIWVLGRHRSVLDLFTGLLVLLVSLTAMFVVLTQPGGAQVIGSWRIDSEMHKLDLAVLVGVCVLGFMTCPYMDLTFHRARLSTSPTSGRVAFVLGFGVFFLTMVAFTLVYSGYILPFITGDPAVRIPDTVHAMIVMHMVVQISFTLAMHLRAIEPAEDDSNRNSIGSRMALAIVAAVLVGIVVQSPRQWFGRDAGEVVYRLFIGFYGLLFPAYVWLCMLPTRRELQAGTVLDPRLWRRKMLVFAFAVGIAAPAYWAGFVTGRITHALPGVALVLLARVALPRLSKTQTQH